MTKSLIIILFFISQFAAAQKDVESYKEGKPYKIDKNQWHEMTHGFKKSNTFKHADYKYGIDLVKDVLGGGIITQRTIYSNSACSCVLIKIYFKKGVPYKLVDHLYKFKKSYKWNTRKWVYATQERRTGYVRCY